jgi:hypothetical protein
LSELTCLELAVGLWFIHLFCQMGAAGGAFSTAYLFSSRDAQQPPKGLVWGRATRAFANYVENFVAFAALDLGLVVHPPHRRLRTDGLDCCALRLSADLSIQRHLLANRSRRYRDDLPVGDALVFHRALNRRATGDGGGALR